MNNKYNDFSALKALKTELAGNADSDKETEQQPKERSLRPGCTVTLMDSNDRGIQPKMMQDFSTV